jgi:predicted phage terminase large subunit-like protein
MDIMRQWLEGSHGVHWDRVENLITFPSGAQLKFGYLRNEADKDQYQGANYHFIGVDELTQFDEDQYLWLMSRNRAPISEADIPLRMWSASNPGRRGHYWVKQRFLIEGELKGRTFVRSLLQDNPHLDYNEYKKTLENLDPVTRQQLLDGNWDVVAGGGFFQRQWFKILDTPPQITLKVRFWDLAATPKTETNDPDWTAGALVSMHDGSYCVENIVRTQQTAQNVEQLIRQTADIDGPGVAVIIEQEPGASGLQVLDYYRRHVLPDRNLRAFRPTGPKESRIAIVSSHVESGNLMLLRGNWISDLLDEAELFPDGHDDQLDSIAGAVAMLQQAGGRTRVRWFGGRQR